MRASTAFVLGLVVCCTGFAQSAEEPPDNTSDDAARGLLELRAKTRMLYNGAFNRNMLKEPIEAEADFARTQSELERVNPDDAGDPSIGNCLFQRGYLSSEAGRYEKAIAIFEDLVRRYPSHAYADDALNQIGFIYQRALRDYDKAADAYARLAKRYADTENAPVAQYRSAQIAAQSGNITDANRLLDDARGNARRQRAGVCVALPRYVIRHGKDDTP